MCADGACAELEWWGQRLADRTCMFKAGTILFQYDSVSKSLVANMRDERDDNGVSLCRPLATLVLLGAAVGENGHLSHAAVVQVCHGRLLLYI